MKRILSPIVLLLFLCVPAATASDAGGPVPLPSGADLPGSTWEGMPISPLPARKEPIWSLRTGFRKGIRDQSLPEELFAGPDAAVLKSGSFAPWSSLLAAFQESSVLVEPDGIAALAGTKPYLIIPSGGLAGTATSSFFRAGLAEYVGAGGVVLCFSQQTGSDLSALPVPDGPKPSLTGAGWTEDGGPLFRASTVQALHPALAGLRRMKPSVVTDGYFITLPREAAVLLRRPDGLPTLALYPFGRGWVVVTTLSSDRLSGQGLLDEEEKTLVRDLILWAKAGGRPVVLEPGTELAVQLALAGPERDEASAVQVLVTGPGREKARDSRSFPLAVKPLQSAILPYTYALPANTAPGIYHLEYALIGGKRAVSPLAESGAGWFAVLPKEPPPAEIPRAQQPLASPGTSVSAAPGVEFTGNHFQLRIVLTRTGAGAPADLIARAAGQEIYFKLGPEQGVASFDLPAGQEGQPLSYAVYHANGRALIRGTVPADLFKRSGVVPDRASYPPGTTVKLRVTGLRAGSFSLMGLGTEREEILRGDGTVAVPVPPSLPAGVYPLAWVLATAAGSRQEGTVPVMIAGTRLSCAGVTLRKENGRGAEGLIAVFSLISTGEAGVTARIAFEGPDGRMLPPQEATVAVRKGTQEVSVPVPFRPDQAGIWRLRYSFLTPLPDGPGFGPGPMTLAAGALLVDAGDAAVLDVRTDPPLTYAPASPMNVTAVAAGTSGTAFDVLLDGKRVGKGRIGPAGTASLTVPVRDIPQGTHTVAAALSGRDLKSARETRFLSGALLPDLVVSLKTSEPKAPALEVGVGITNQGKAASPATEGSLYEGDPRAGGRRIRSFPVPPLEPGKQFVAIVPWPLAGKAGKRTLVASIDENGKVLETARDNDRVSFTIEIPEVQLSVFSLKPEYGSDETVDYHARVANFTAAPLKALALQLQVTGPAGNTLGTQTIALPDLAPGTDQVIDRALDIITPPEGIYLVSGRISAGGTPIASDSRGIAVLPTLLLKGSLEGTPATAAPCRPLEIRTSAWSAGNTPPTNGTLKLEIRSKALGQVVYAIQLPFVLEARTTRIEKVDYPRGEYTISLGASAVNQQRGITKDSVLAEQPLTVGDAVTVKRSTAPFPRVLVWAGEDQSTTIERALTEKMVQEAFADDTAYTTVVTSSDAFVSRALTGMFNDYLLIDINETLDAAEALKHGLTQGHGVIIAGPGERSRLMAESFDFRFEQLTRSGPFSITVPAAAGFGLAGSLPLSGPALVPARKSARTLATYSDGRPAILMDKVDRGRIMVLPFSLTRSALNTGFSAIYSRLIREAVLATVPQAGEPDDLASVTLTISSSTGPVQARLAENLPAGATMLWSSARSVSEKGAATFEVTAESEPKTIYYFFRPGGAGERTSFTTVYSACGGTFMNQGKVE